MPSLSLGLTSYACICRAGTYSRGGLIVSSLVGRVERDGSVRLSFILPPAVESRLSMRGSSV